MKNVANNDLKDFLEEEAKVLKSGALKDLESLLARKTALAEQMQKMDVKALPEVSRLLKRNERLAKGAMEGLRDVMERMTDARAVRQCLDTYTDDGKRSSVEQRHTRRLEKRA